MALGNMHILNECCILLSRQYTLLTTESEQTATWFSEDCHLFRFSGKQQVFPGRVVGQTKNKKTLLRPGLGKHRSVPGKHNAKGSLDEPLDLHSMSKIILHQKAPTLFISMIIVIYLNQNHFSRCAVNFSESLEILTDACLYGPFWGIKKSN